MALADEGPRWLEPIAPELPALAIEARAAIEREGALTADDILDRRLRLGLVPSWYEAARPAVESLIAHLPPSRIESARGAVVDESSDSAPGAVLAAGSNGPHGAPGSASPTIVGR
jgi:glycerol-3-phosphate dehydrogenase